MIHFSCSIRQKLNSLDAISARTLNTDLTTCLYIPTILVVHRHQWPVCGTEFHSSVCHSHNSTAEKPCSPTAKVPDSHQQRKMYAIIQVHLNVIFPHIKGAQIAVAWSPGQLHFFMMVSNIFSITVAVFLPYIPKMCIILLEPCTKRQVKLMFAGESRIMGRRYATCVTSSQWRLEF